MAQAQGGSIGETTLGAEPQSGSGEAFIDFGRAACIGALGGLGVGFVMGVVNRIVMRIVAVMNGPTTIETDFGATVLNFTVPGTLGLIVVTAIFGIVPGLLYVGLRRLLPGGLVVRGLVFGVLTGALYGSRLVDSTARDFRLLGVPLVSSAMFLGMFVLFGLLIAPVVARLDRRLSRAPSNRVSAVYAVVGGLITLIASQALFGGRWSWLLVVPLGFALAVSAGEQAGSGWIAHRRLVRGGGYLALALPLVLGLIDISQELRQIALFSATT
jgi:hypothetical protein